MQATKEFVYEVTAKVSAPKGYTPRRGSRTKQIKRVRAACAEYARRKATSALADQGFEVLSASAKRWSAK